MFGKKSTQLFKTKNIKFKSFERSLCLIYLIAVDLFRVSCGDGGFVVCVVVFLICLIVCKQPNIDTKRKETSNTIKDTNPHQTPQQLSLRGCWGFIICWCVGLCSYVIYVVLVVCRCVIYVSDFITCFFGCRCVIICRLYVSFVCVVSLLYV